MASEVLLKFIEIISYPLSLYFLNKMFKWIAIWYSSVISLKNTAHFACRVCAVCVCVYLLRSVGWMLLWFLYSTFQLVCAAFHQTTLQNSFRPQPQHSVHSIPYNTSTGDSILVLVFGITIRQQIYYTNKLDSAVVKCKLTTLTCKMLLWIKKKKHRMMHVPQQMHCTFEHTKIG